MYRRSVTVERLRSAVQPHISASFFEREAFPAAEISLYDVRRRVISRRLTAAKVRVTFDRLSHHSQHHRHATTAS